MTRGGREGDESHSWNKARGRAQSCKERTEEQTKGCKMCLAVRQRIQKTEGR